MPVSEKPVLQEYAAVFVNRNLFFGRIFAEYHPEPSIYASNFTIFFVFGSVIGTRDDFLSERGGADECLSL
jgi:hypothetical protein